MITTTILFKVAVQTNPCAFLPSLVLIVRLSKLSHTEKNWASIAAVRYAIKKVVF